MIVAILFCLLIGAVIAGWSKVCPTGLHEKKSKQTNKQKGNILFCEFGRLPKISEFIDL